MTLEIQQMQDHFTLKFYFNSQFIICKSNPDFFNSKYLNNEYYDYFSIYKNVLTSRVKYANHNDNMSSGAIYIIMNQLQ